MDRERQRKIEARERRLSSLKSQFSSVDVEVVLEEEQQIEEGTTSPRRGRKKKVNLAGTK